MSTTNDRFKKQFFYQRTTTKKDVERQFFFMLKFSKQDLKLRHYAFCLVDNAVFTHVRR